jgi:hypothetical protein
MKEKGSFRVLSEARKNIVEKTKDIQKHTNFIPTKTGKYEI